jgi:hypothetical protein
MLPLYELYHPKDEVDCHCENMDCGCGTLLIVENMQVFIVHAPPPEHQYCQAIQDFLSRCLN